MQLSRGIRYLVLFVLITIPWLVYGDEPEILELKDRIDSLEREVELINQTLIEMMEMLSASSSTSMSEQYSQPGQLKWEDKQNWRRLRSGMVKDEVILLLGEPDKIDKYSSFEVWSYGYPGGGTVEYSSQGRVDGWREPR